MTVSPSILLSEEREEELLARARAGDRASFGELVEPWRKPLFGYIYRTVTHRPDAEDLLQDVLVRALEGLSAFRRESRFKSWLFGIATHVCLDHLRTKRRWRSETQLEAEVLARSDPERMTEIQGILGASGARYEIREHIAFCFSCVGRTLDPPQQAALFLREVMGFTAQEGAETVGVSEPRFRHLLSAARATMIESFEGMCQLINKTGACWQCRGLRELAPESNQGSDLVRIEVGPEVSVTPESLFEARVAIVRGADLEDGGSRNLHADFFAAVTRQEQERTDP